MAECDFQIQQTDFYPERTEDDECIYCTNPIQAEEEVKKTSWLDDLGWI